MRRLLLMFILLAPRLVLGSASDARPLPILGTAYRLTLPLYNAAGTALLTGATGLDSECSGNTAALADCTNELTEIGGGLYEIDLTAAEMNFATVNVVINVSGIPPLVAVINPSTSTGEQWPVNAADLLMTGHVAAGTAGGLWNSAGSSGDPLTATCSAYTIPGTFGYIACAKLPIIGTTGGTVPSPATGGGPVTIRCGDTYAPANGENRKIQFYDSTGVWGTFVGSTAWYSLMNGSTPKLITATTVTDANTLTTPLTAAQTGSLCTSAGGGANYTYYFRVILTGGYTGSDGAAAADSTTFTSAGANFLTTVAGNGVYLAGTGTGVTASGSGTCTAGLYRVVSRTNSTTLVLDRAPCSVTGSSLTYTIGAVHTVATSTLTAAP